MTKWDSVKGSMRDSGKPPLPMPKCSEDASPLGPKSEWSGRNEPKKFFESKVGTRPVSGINRLGDGRWNP